MIKKEDQWTSIPPNRRMLHAPQKPWIQFKDRRNVWKGKLITQAIECYEHFVPCNNCFIACTRTVLASKKNHRNIELLTRIILSLWTNYICCCLMTRARLIAWRKTKAIQELKIKRKFRKDDKIVEQDNKNEEFSSSEGEPVEESENNSD